MRTLRLVLTALLCVALSDVTILAQGGPGDNYYGGPLGRIGIFIGEGQGGGAAPYPPTVTNGTLTVQIYGGSNTNRQFLHPFAVSVEASPLTNRASWVKPPYQTTFGEPPP